MKRAGISGAGSVANAMSVRREAVDFALRIPSILRTPPLRSMSPLGFPRLASQLLFLLSLNRLLPPAVLLPALFFINLSFISTFHTKTPDISVPWQTLSTLLPISDTLFFNAPARHSRLSSFPDIVCRTASYSFIATLCRALAQPRLSQLVMLLCQSKA